jgi:hypothetical protein
VEVVGKGDKCALSIKGGTPPESTLIPLPLKACCNNISSILKEHPSRIPMFLVM